MYEDMRYELKAGVTPTFEFEVCKEGTIFPLDDVTINFILADFENKVPILTKTTSDFVRIGNKATITLSVEETSNLSGEYEYQIFYEDALDNVDRVDGRLFFKPKIQ